MLFPGVKMTDMVIGLDFHGVSIPPAPLVPMVPHPYFGMIFLWMTPKFASVDTLINGMPAATAGSMGYSVHPPQGIPVPPSMLNMMYWRRHLLNIPKGLMLVALTMLANLAISRISALFVSPDSATGRFIADATGGVNTSGWGGTWGTIKGSFSAYTQWSTWIKLLIPALPYPGDQGSAAIGSPNVTVNGGALAFNAPLMAASCSDLMIVPNGATVGFSNVMVGVSIAAMLRALAVNAAQGAVSAGVSAGVNRVSQGRRQTQQDH
jgi:hypothetical protein